MAKTVLITQSNYIPWKGYFDAINIADEFIIFDEVQYTRRDWRNRNKIVTSNGVKWLTIPVSVKGKYDQTVNQTRVSDPKWRVRHWNTIRMNYARAPFFKRYEALFEALYLEENEEFLSRINERFIKSINHILDIRTRISRCQDYRLSTGKTARLIDLCLQSGASEYLTGPAARAYLDEAQFVEAGIRIKWLDYGSYPVYPQLQADFEHGVSIIDLLFNTGPDAYRYLKTFGR